MSEVSDSQWNQFWTALGLGPKDTSANLTLSRFGNFAANFEKLPPPLQDEYIIPLYGIIVSSGKRDKKENYIQYTRKLINCMMMED